MTYLIENDLFYWKLLILLKMTYEDHGFQKTKAGVHGKGKKRTFGQHIHKRGTSDVWRLGSDSYFVTLTMKMTLMMTRTRTMMIMIIWDLNDQTRMETNDRCYLTLSWSWPWPRPSPWIWPWPWWPCWRQWLGRRRWKPTTWRRCSLTSRLASSIAPSGSCFVVTLIWR